MSKQLTLSAAIAVLSMGLFAAVAGLGTPDAANSAGTRAPLFELTASR